MAELEGVVTRPDSPRGIGGWLILPIIHLFADLGVLIFGVAAGFRKGTAASQISSDAFPQGAIFFVLFLFFAVAVCAYAAYCLVRLFQKKRDVPELMMVFYVLVAIKAVITLGLLRHFPNAQTTDDVLRSAWQGFFGAVAAAIVWIAYFRKSVRVRNTFVN
jgi:hypothetical protein